MNKKGFLTWEVTLGLIIGAFLIFFFYKWGYGYIGDIYGAKNKCPEGSLDLIDGIIANFDKGAEGAKKIPTPLYKKCSLVSFSQGLAPRGEGGLLTVPNKCVGENCLCLCYEGDDNKLDGNDCSRNARCKKYEKELVGGAENGQVRVEGSGNMESIYVDVGGRICIGDERTCGGVS